MIILMHFEQVTMEGYKFTITLTVKLTRYEKYEKKKKKDCFQTKALVVLFCFVFLLDHYRTSYCFSDYLFLYLFQTIYFINAKHL